MAVRLVGWMLLMLGIEWGLENVVVVEGSCFYYTCVINVWVDS